MESLVGWSSGSVLAGGSGRPTAPSGPDSGALGGSFRSAPRSVGYTTAESCGNRRAHPGCRPERSSQSAISRLERSPRESSPRHRVARRPLGQQPRQRGSSPRHRVARHLRVAKRGGSCAPEEWAPLPGSSAAEVMGWSRSPTSGESLGVGCAAGSWPAAPGSAEGASGRLLRAFLSAALLHPPLRPFFSYSEGSRSVAEEEGRSRRECRRAARTRITAR